MVIIEAEIFQVVIDADLFPANLTLLHLFANGQIRVVFERFRIPGADFPALKPIHNAMAEERKRIDAGSGHLRLEILHAGLALGVCEAILRKRVAVEYLHLNPGREHILDIGPGQLGHFPLLQEGIELRGLGVIGPVD